MGQLLNLQLLWRKSGMKLICIPFPMESISLLFYELLFNRQLHTETKSEYRAILSPTSCSWVFERFEVFYPHWVVQSLLPDRTWRSAEYIRMRSLKIAYQRFAGPRIKKIAIINAGVDVFLTVRMGYNEALPVVCSEFELFMRTNIQSWVWRMQ